MSPDTAGLLWMLLMGGLLGAFALILRAPNPAQTHLVNLVLVLREGESYAQMLATLTGATPAHFSTARGLRFALETLNARDVEMGFVASHRYEATAEGAMAVEDAARQLWRHQATSAEIAPHTVALPPLHPFSSVSSAPDGTPHTLCLVGLVLVARQPPCPDGATNSALVALGVLKGAIAGPCYCYCRSLGSGHAAWSEAETLLPQLRAIKE